MVGAIYAPRVHDLLLLRSGRFHPASTVEPSWVQMEMRSSPCCGFLHEEYALRRSTKIMIRTPEGHQLVKDPWDEPNKGHLK